MIIFIVLSLSDNNYDYTERIKISSLSYDYYNNNNYYFNKLLIKLFYYILKIS